jgi:hypothetical protein
MFFIEAIKLAHRCAFWGHRWDRSARYKHNTCITSERADNLMAVYINEKSVLQFETHFPNAFSYNYTCPSFMLIFTYC